MDSSFRKKIRQSGRYLKGGQWVGWMMDGMDGYSRWIDCCWSYLISQGMPMRAVSVVQGEQVSPSQAPGFVCFEFGVRRGIVSQHIVWYG